MENVCSDCGGIITVPTELRPHHPKFRTLCGGVALPGAEAAQRLLGWSASAFRAALRNTHPRAMRILHSALDRIAAAAPIPVTPDGYLRILASRGRSDRSTHDLPARPGAVPTEAIPVTRRLDDIVRENRANAPPKRSFREDLAARRDTPSDFTDRARAHRAGAPGSPLRIAAGGDQNIPPPTPDSHERIKAARTAAKL